MPLQRHLVVFTRYPSFGTGKRRLAAGVGATTALRFQRVGLAHAMHRLGTDRRWRMWLAVTPDGAGPWPPWIDVMPQGRGDLGDRLARVIDRLPPGPVLIVGSDIPDVTPDVTAKAFHLLEGHEAVIGPSTDGGYWAIGLRRRPCSLHPFAKVRWSTEFALADTVANLQGRSLAQLPLLDDVDDAACLKRHAHWELLTRRPQSVRGSIARD
jgi:rSAM/selenodomain-associated transferase 1